MLAAIRRLTYSLLCALYSFTLLLHQVGRFTNRRIRLARASSLFSRHFSTSSLSFFNVSYEHSKTSTLLFAALFFFSPTLLRVTFTTYRNRSPPSTPTPPSLSSSSRPSLPSRCRPLFCRILELVSALIRHSIFSNCSVVFSSSISAIIRHALVNSVLFRTYARLNEAFVSSLIEDILDEEFVTFSKRASNACGLRSTDAHW